jgi:hypothetical protein
MAPVVIAAALLIKGYFDCWQQRRESTHHLSVFEEGYGVSIVLLGCLLVLLGKC